MSMDQDVEHGAQKDEAELREPLIKNGKSKDKDELQSKAGNKGSIAVVLFSTFVAVLGSYEFGSCVGYSTPVQSAIMEDLGLSVAEYAVFCSIVTIGAMIGAVTSGRIADAFGRKWAMRISAVFSIVGWICIYFSKGASLLDGGRLLTGYGIGVFSYVVPIYVAEIAPKNLRGGLATTNQFMIVIGASVAFVVGTVVTWRMLALIGIIPCLIQLVGLAFVPESPRWLAKAGCHEEFENALRKLRGKDTDISCEAAEIQDYVDALQNQAKSTILDLFRREYLYSLVIGVGLMVFQQFSGANGMGSYTSEILVLAGFSSGKIGVRAFACIQIPITALGAFLTDNCGRKPLLLVSATGTFFGCFLAGTGFLLKAHNLLTDWTPMLVLSGILVYIGSFAIGMGAVPWVIMSEIFPIDIKGAAAGLVTLVNWSGAWVVTYTFNFMMDWSYSGTFYVYSGFCAGAVLFVAKVVPETKGRTLEEIQAYLNS